MKYTVLTIALVLNMQRIMAQVPAIEWAKCFGGTDGEVGRCIRQTKDTGYIVLGNAGSANGHVYKNEGSEDCWIVKLDKFGDTVWTRVLGGSELEFGISVQQTYDDGFIVAAQSSSSNGDFAGGRTGNYDCWIIKLDQSGKTQWKKQFGGTGNDVPRDILITEDSGYIVAGTSSSGNGDIVGNHGSSDFWVLRLNKSGDIIWTKSYGGTGSDQAFSIYRKNNTGYLLAGQSDSKNGDVRGNHGKIDYWILEINNNGDTLWTKTLGGKEDDFGQSIQQTIDGGLVIGGASKSGNGDVTGHHGDSTRADLWIVKLNSNREIEWQKSLGGTHDEALYGTLLAFSMMQTPDGGNIIVSYTRSADGDITSNNGGSDVWLLKLTNSGSIEWQRSLGGTTTDYGYSVLQTFDGSYVFSGMAGTNSGDVSGNQGSADLWVVKFASAGSSVVSTEFTKLQVYPNPSEGSFYIKSAPIGSILSVMDMMGKVLYSSNITHEKTNIRLSDIGAGTYMLKIEENGAVAYRKIIVLN